MSCDENLESSKVVVSIWICLLMHLFLSKAFLAIVEDLIKFSICG